MKKAYLSVFLFVVVFGVAFLAKPKSPSLAADPDPRPGETWIWIYEVGSGLPETPWPDCNDSDMARKYLITQHVIDVKKGWVKYEELGQTRCDTIRVFKLGAHRVDSK